MILGDTANEKRWVIIATEWGGENEIGPLIPPENRPTVFQGSRDVAEAELLRLEQKHHKCFALFEAVAYARRVGGSDRFEDAGKPIQTAYVVEPITGE